MKSIKYVCDITVLSVLLFPALSLAQGTLTITFNGPPAQPTNSQYGLNSYSESGMLFLPGPSDFDNQFERDGGGQDGIDPYDGSPYLQTGYGESLEFSFSNGFLFGLASVDLAAYSTHIPDYTVDFVGYRADGSTISASFSGTGANFQTFDFGSDWSSGLTEVQIPDAPWSLDNLVVIVPEPSSAALFCVGAVTFVAFHLKRRKQL